MKKSLFPILFVFTIASCSIFGVHFKIHNPHRAGKFPKPTAALKTFGNQESRFRTCYDVTYYYLSVRFGQNLSVDRGISGSVGIRAVATEALDTLQLDLAKEMTLSAVHEGSVSREGMSVDGDAEFFRKDGAVFVRFPKQIHKGESISLILDFSGTPPEAKRPPWAGGFVRKKDDLKNPWWGVACETEGASTWWPCKDVVNDEPDSVDIDYWVPKGLTAVGNGQLIDPEERGFSSAPGATEALHPCCWHVSYPINLYDITFYIGNFKLLHDEYISSVTHDTLQLNHYVLAQHYDKAKEQFAQAKDVLKFYEETYGPYAFYRDGYKLVESPYEGMEHQSAIAYGNGFKTSPWGFDYIILHETAHEWWGNAVTAYDLADGWLHEGFATYSEALYVEKKYGHDAYERYMLQYRMFIINRRPVVAPYGQRYFNYKDGDIYMKGCWVLHSLRYAVHNDSLFFDILRSFYSEYKYKNATSGDLEKLVNEKTGNDYHWFFEQYLHNRFTPELEYCVKDNYLYFRWAKTGNDFHLPVNVEIFGNTPLWTTIQPSATTIQRVPANDPNGVGSFNDNDCLFKPVENKQLAKIFRKQPKI